MLRPFKTSGFPRKYLIAPNLWPSGCPKLNQQILSPRTFELEKEGGGKDGERKREGEKRERRREPGVSKTISGGRNNTKSSSRSNSVTMF